MRQRPRASIVALVIRAVAVAGILASGVAASVESVQAVPVDLELILAADVSGSIDVTDFALQRSGFEAAFRNPAVIAAIEGGAIGSIAVTLRDFANQVSIAVDWTVISDAASSNAFADAIAGAPRPGSVGANDGQSNMINQALTALNTNNFEGTRSVLDIASEGAQDVEGCTSSTLSCQSVQDARDAFLAGGGTAINAIWLRDRDFFGIHAGALINAFDYGSLNVIGGPGSFQVFAEDFSAFGPAIEAKLIREIEPVSEPGTLMLLGLGLGVLGYVRRRAARGGLGRP